MNRTTLVRGYLAECRTRPFRPGQHDCALFFAGWIAACGGADHAAAWRGKYRTLAAGQKMVEDLGFTDHVDFFARKLPAIHPALARLGDGAVVEDADGAGLGIVAGERVFVLRPEGLGSVGLERAVRAMRVI